MDKQDNVSVKMSYLMLLDMDHPLVEQLEVHGVIML